ncbi:GIY-YIG nuclease family protein [Sphingomicrobium flavum]|uniref:GIY-YIG nuclease family protein n=1 Tax=Sphingomicrobium flavum TaxID=1229164 RepID=UPI0021AD5160|nr:GIY-YIG nuclease family protein [Sphingomicrobium flavum]
MNKGGWVYMLADRYRGTIYTGVTANLPARIHTHRTNPQGFVARYGLDRLVMAEWHDDISDAIAREKAIKKWKRSWKIRLIEEQNPDWLDRFETINA